MTLDLAAWREKVNRGRVRGERPLWSDIETLLREIDLLQHRREESLAMVKALATPRELAEAERAVLVNSLRLRRIQLRRSDPRIGETNPTYQIVLDTMLDQWAEDVDTLLAATDTPAKVSPG